MKPFRAASALALGLRQVATTFATPITIPPVLSIRSVHDMDPRNLHAGEMAWTGRVHPDDTTETTLWGDAQSIYAQFMAINPHFSVENKISDPATPPATPPTTSTLSKRDPPGVLQCANPMDFLHIPRTQDCDGAKNSLLSLGGGNATCWVGNNSDHYNCQKVASSLACDIILCNTVGVPWDGYCRDIVTDVNNIQQKCNFSMQLGSKTRWAAGKMVFFDHETQLSGYHPY